MSPLERRRWPAQATDATAKIPDQDHPHNSSRVIEDEETPPRRPAPLPIPTFDPALYSEHTRAAVEQLLGLDRAWYVRGSVAAWMARGRPIGSQWCSNLLQLMTSAAWIGGGRQRINGRTVNVVLVDPQALARRLWCQ